jgi:Tol biopolymer transport system component
MPTAAFMEHDVFISHSSDDKSIANAIVATLEHNNLRCWAAPRDIRPSDDWGSAISRAIEQSKVFLLVFSANANHSQRVLDELNLAISKEIPILPFRIENLQPDGAMMLHLSSRHWLDAYDPSWESHLKKLISTVSSMLDTNLDDAKIEIHTTVQQKISLRRHSRVWRILAGILGAAVFLILGWLGLSNRGILGIGTTPEGQTSTDQALLTQVARENDCRIAFSSTRSGTLNLWLMDPDGSNQSQLSFNDYGEFIGSWTLDGTEFIFFSWRGGENEIFIMDSNGTTIRQITDNDSMESMPKLSPDGEWIAFYSDSTGNMEIFKMRVDGSALQQLSFEHGIYAEYSFPPAPTHLSWSPDGERIAFISDRDGDGEIFIMDQDGSNIWQLTSNEDQDAWPAWSPQGDKIVFHSNRFGDYEIFTVNADTFEVVQLTSNLGISSEPAWSADGRIAFTSDRTGDSELWVMAEDGGDQQQLTNVEGYDGGPVWSPLCKPGLDELGE